MQIHGGISGEELLDKGREIVDFSVSVNPAAPMPLLKTVPDFHRYPARSSRRFCQIISDFYKINSNTILPLGGATEGIYLLPRLFKNPVGLFPLYGDYVEAFAREKIDVTPFDKLPEFTDADLFLIVNPQNPTGYYIELSDIINFASANPDTAVIVDEAYQEMGHGCETLIRREIPKNIVVLRSLTKSTGWPSLRAGFFVADQSMIEKFQSWVLPWQITTLQLELIDFFYKNYVQFQATWETSSISRTALCRQLDELGCTVLHGSAPFITFKIPSETDLQSYLLNMHSILIRDCTSFGLQSWYRVMPQGTEDNLILISAIENSLKQ